jgi:hypothetical protein
MNARLARLALALYPLAYRRRYGEEMESLIEDSGASPASVVDLLRGALRAHLRPEPGVEAELGPDDRVRLGLGGVLLCWIVFAVAGLGLYKTTEGHSFTAAGDAHGVVGTAHLAIQILAALATAAVVVGAAPLVLAALRQAHDRHAVERATMIAVGCVVVFGIATAGLVVVGSLRPAPSDTLSAVSFAIWTVLVLGCGIGCVLAARVGLFAITIPKDMLRVISACATVVVLGMAGIALGTAVYLVALAHDAPGLAGQGNGPLELLSVGASLAIQLVVMVVVLVPAGVGAARARARG